MEKFLSRQQVQVILEQAPSNVDKGKLIQSLADRGYKLEGFNDKPIPKKEGSISNAFHSGVEQTKSGYEEAKNAENPVQLLEGSTKMLAGGINTAFSPLAPITKPIGDAVNFVSDKISSIPAVQDFATSKAGENTARVAENVGNVATIAGTVAGGLETPKIIKATPGVISKVAKDLTIQSEKQIESNILKDYSKGVKPSIAGKNNTVNIKNYKDNVLNAVKTIKDNSANLSFTDDLGEVTTGKTPKSLKELTEAVEQTKKTIFNQYDSLSKQAGEAGINIDISPIASELDSVINNKALSITNPKAIEYATDLKNRLSNVGKLDTVTAQEVIQNYNKSLEAFYKNPSYDTASQVSIDALIANRIRESLDEGISGLTGEQYGALKKQYGALKSIEKDVVKASLKDARKSTKGLIDFSDILSGGQVVNGILSVNPGQIASGLTQKAISEFYKYLNNPNRAIKNMFESVGKLPVKARK